jgi:hypothetical protein
LGSGLHLFLDALQIKWGNGVHFFAPFSWRMTQFGLFWPESPVTDFFTLTGLGILVFFGFRNSADAPAPRHGNQAKAWAFAALILAGYFFSPLALLSGPERANNHFAATLRNREDRLGKPIALDRASWRPKEGLRVFSGDVLVAEGLAGVPAGAVSLQGRFTAPDRIRVRRWHIHRPGIRDLASYIGLLGVAGAWGWGAAGFRRCKEKGPNAG